MNIKRAFLTAAAVLMVPGYAMAQTVTATFDTTIVFTNGFDGSVNVELACDGGNPLTQDADISEAMGVQFSVENLDLATRTCSITLTGLASGYELTDASDDCVFSNVAQDADVLEESNICDLEAAPVSSNFSVDIDWLGVDDGSISQDASVTLSCAPASADTGSVFGTVSSMFMGTGSQTYSLDFYPIWDEEGTLCNVIVDEGSLDSAVEAVVSCGTNGIYFFVGDEEGECSVTMTAFFEGIPTLSQYGMAIMVLLMLGVGFVGFRRFV